MALLHYKTEGVSDLTTPGHVYFVQGVDGGMVKIGWATDPKARLAKMQAHSPVRLRIIFSEPGNGRDERALHEKFAKDRQHGEWFAPSQELLAEIEMRRGRNEPKPYIPAKVPTPQIVLAPRRKVVRKPPAVAKSSFVEAAPGSEVWGKLAKAMGAIDWKR